MQSARRTMDTSATIYDVARSAGVSIASVSRVLNGHDSPRPETRDRVLHAAEELGFVPAGPARAVAVKLKQAVGVVFRRLPRSEMTEGRFAQEDESLQFTDVINRGIEVAAHRRGCDLLIGSVDVDDYDAHRRIMAMARRSDGLILHDRLLEPGRLAQISQHVPVVTLAGIPSQVSASVRGDNCSGMRELARHLIHDHGYLTIAYLSGHPDSPDNVARRLALAEEAAGAGVAFVDGPHWQGNYFAAGGARVIAELLAGGMRLPRAIVCANDQTALGVMDALARRGIDVPGDVAVTGFDDIPVAGHLRPRLTTVRQPIQDLGSTAFETLRSMIGNREPARMDVVLPTRLIRRESCGCPPHVTSRAEAHEGALEAALSG